MKTKKTLAILLAVMMILSSVPMLASAAPIALTEANVTVWPTANGSIYFGQKISDGVTLSGGEVQYNGAVVAGHFEFVDPELRPTYSSSQLSALKFIPDDTINYTGFEVEYPWEVFYAMNQTTPVFVDENDTVPVATEVEPGARLSTSTLSGAQVMNPYYPEEPTALAGVWKWASSRTVVNESGYYEARITISGYIRLTAQVYVRIIGDTTEEEPVVSGEVTSWPTIECPEWTPGMTVADLTLTGGEATVEGTFAISTDATTILKPNEDNSIKIDFTPADSEVIMTGATTKTIQITPTFTVKDITVTVDPDFVCTYEYGKSYLANLDRASAFGITTDVPSNIKVNVFVSSAVDKDGNPVDNYDRYLTPGEYTARVAVSTSAVKVDGVGNVQLYNSPVFIENVPIVITKQKSTKAFGSVVISGTNEDEGQSTATIHYSFYEAEGVDGHCVLKVNGETVLDNIAPTDTTTFSTYLFATDTSGTYTATLEYVPAETDYVEFETTVLSQEFELEVLEPEAPIIPILPGGDDDDDNDDNDDNTGDDNDGGDSDITLPDLDLDADGSHKFSFVNIIKNLVEALKAFIQQIGDFFGSLSLDSLGGMIG